MCGFRILLVLLLVLQISGQMVHAAEKRETDLKRFRSKTEPKSLRLEGGASLCEGKLEKLQGLNWTRVGAYNSDLRFANRVCLELGCGSAVSVSGETRTEEKKWFINSKCEETSVDDCFTGPSPSTTEALYLKCSDSVRLRGPSLCSGSLELHQNQAWTSVCEGDFDLQDAEVVCRELGCGAPSLLQGALYGEVRALGQTFLCKGNESALMDCPRSSSGNTCSSGTAVELTCSEPVRLVGGASRCNGTVEVRLRGDWRPVVDWYGSWDLEATAAVCRDLDCGPAVSGEKRDGFPLRPMWWVLVDCVKKSALRECVSGEVNSGQYGVNVVCSDKPKPTDHRLLLLLVLVPVVLVLVLVLLIFHRKRSWNVQRCPEDPQRTSPEDPQRTSPEDPQRTTSEIQMYSRLQPQDSQ